MKIIFYQILITAIILTVAPLIGTAQNDLPLYQTVISDDIDAQIDTASNVNQQLDPNKKNQQKPAVVITDSEEIGEQLRNLQRLYLAGKYDEAIQLSQTIRENYSLKPDDEIDRQKYTIASLKEMEYNEQADSAAKVFLGKNPFYYKHQKSSDPVPFTEIISNYYTTPKLSVWASIGQTLTIPLLDTVHVITDTLQMEPDYELSSGEKFEIGIEYHINKYLAVSLAPTYAKYMYTRSINRSMRSQFIYEETSKLLYLPLRIEAYWPIRDGKWMPSIYLGASLKYVLKSTYNAYTETPGERRYEAEDIKQDPDAKNQINFAGLGGVRLSFSFNRITIFGDLGLSVDCKPFNNPDAAMLNADLAYDKMYIPDIFHISEASAMVGVKINLCYKTIAKYGYGH